jgi:hypothetical protein
MIQAGQGKNAGPYPQNNYSKKDWGVAQVAEHLPSKVPNKTLSSTPVTRAHTHTHTHTHKTSGKPPFLYSEYHNFFITSIFY